MNIINLTHTQFQNYSNLHSNKNFGQTIEYTKLNNIESQNKLFLGLVDESNILHAAACIIINNISSIIKEAIAKDGFLIDYTNTQLLETFIKKLVEYLKLYKVTYLKTDPKFKYKVYNKKNIVIENNEYILDTFIRLGFQNNGYLSDFGKYDVIIENYTSVNDIYHKFNRNTKRNIKDSINTGITLHKGTKNDISNFYEIIKKKKDNSIKYYESLLNAYNTPENKMDIFFTKINIQKFLINSKKLYEQEKERNEQIHKNFERNIGHVSNKMYNKKVNSDKLLNKYHNNLKLATELSLTNQSEVIVGTAAVIRNGLEVYFLIDGYSEKYRSIHSSHLLKWAIIEKFYKQGYNKFNLGEVHQLYFSPVNKYHGQYLYKIGFGGNIVEYPPEMMLLINKRAYNTANKINTIFKNNKKTN